MTIWIFFVNEVRDMRERRNDEWIMSTRDCMNMNTTTWEDEILIPVLLHFFSLSCHHRSHLSVDSPCSRRQHKGHRRHKSVSITLKPGTASAGRFEEKASENNHQRVESHINWTPHFMGINVIKIFRYVHMNNHGDDDYDYDGICFFIHHRTLNPMRGNHKNVVFSAPFPDLSTNNISSLTEDNFKGQQNLLELDLSSNQLTSINPGTFKFLIVSVSPLLHGGAREKFLFLVDKMIFE